MCFLSFLQNVNISAEESDSDDGLPTESSPGPDKAYSVGNGFGYEHKTNLEMEASNDTSKYNTVPSKFDSKQLKRDELDELLRVERDWKEHDKPYQTLPNNVIPLISKVNDLY